MVKGITGMVWGKKKKKVKKIDIEKYLKKWKRN